MTTKTLHDRLFDEGEIQVHDDAHSHKGETMVTLSIGFEDHILTPKEAKELGEMLIWAAKSASMSFV